MMNSIGWERDKAGVVAYIKPPKSSRFISPSTAAAIVKKLMHEVTTISASFSPDDVVVFSRLAGISVFGDRRAEYYGLYASSGATEGVNYCLRRCTWEREFRSMDEVLNALSAQTLFFDVERLVPSNRDMILAADSQAKDEYQILSESSKNDVFVGRQISYFVCDEKKELAATYRGESSTNPAVERLFQGLKTVFDALVDGGTVDPLPDSLRVSYSFFPIAETLGFTSGQPLRNISNQSP